MYCLKLICTSIQDLLPSFLLYIAVKFLACTHPLDNRSIDCTQVLHGTYYYYFNKALLSLNTETVKDKKKTKIRINN